MRHTREIVSSGPSHPRHIKAYEEMAGKGPSSFSHLCFWFSILVDGTATVSYEVVPTGPQRLFLFHLHESSEVRVNATKQAAPAPRPHLVENEQGRGQEQASKRGTRKFCSDGVSRGGGVFVHEIFMRPTCQWPQSRERSSCCALQQGAAMHFSQNER
jgi:hypothetical protein